MKRRYPLLLLSVLAVSLLACGGEPDRPRVLVLGIDGLDPQTIDLCIEFLMGHLVHARRLRDDIRNRNAGSESSGDESSAGDDADFNEDLFVAKIVTYAAGGIRACAAD